jgi:hypothetical protein
MLTREGGASSLYQTMRRTLQIGILALALVAGAHTAFGERFAYSVVNVGRQLQQGDGGHAIGVIERLVLSLAS